ncbi:hypothetical protein QYE76_007884 [Lolium multiflorum]|uniref:Reverse transcriptase Ty1/copia-type domain-containing protein n=1 Tax=Lolium multiflorum TaxID=4521 RepID=A0AAD8QH45_LOLMU|nr:hypothetical protein QYE76_007884 [Lolium multiflorum]
MSSGGDGGDDDEDDGDGDGDDVQLDGGDDGDFLPEEFPRIPAGELFLSVFSAPQAFHHTNAHSHTSHNRSSPNLLRDPLQPPTCPSISVGITPRQIRFSRPANPCQLARHRVAIIEPSRIYLACCVCPPPRPTSYHSHAATWPHPPANAVPIKPPENAHRMTTRAKDGYLMPRKLFSLSSSAITHTISPLPSTYRQALKDPNWHAAMLDEYNALLQNDTWSLVPCPAGANVVTGKWIYRHKLNADGTLSRYKARWVVRGFSQQAGVDYGETFSPVVKAATIRVVLALATAQAWPINQMDVKNAFLHGNLQETVYCQQPSGFVDSNLPHHVCRLNKSLYGLKQAPRTWFTRFTSYLFTIGFHASKCDSSLFILRRVGQQCDDGERTVSWTAIVQQGDGGERKAIGQQCDDGESNVSWTAIVQQGDGSERTAIVLPGDHGKRKACWTLRTVAGRQWRREVLLARARGRREVLLRGVSNGFDQHDLIISWTCRRLWSIRPLRSKMCGI